jgi:aminoglycoside/choline kinase family phosphotransferase
MSDFRQVKLTMWVTEVLGQLKPENRGEISLSLVSGDASFRRYFRTHLGDSSFVAVDAPPKQEDSRMFVHICNMFRDADISVPKVFFADYEQGFMLLDDFGDQLYLDVLLDLRTSGCKNEINSLYEAAINSLLDIQSRVNKNRLDSYSKNELHREMALFEEWFCKAFLGLKINGAEREVIAKTLNFLEEAALSQEQVVVHRDYHSRNLMILDDNIFGEDSSPGIIDFQDAVSGAYTYDLVSLLRDAYICWDAGKVDSWALYYLERAKSSGLIANIDEAQFQRDFDLMGLQRQLKVLGIFARLYIRDNKVRYLADIPQVIDYFLEVSQRYMELRPFLHWFRTKVLPIAETKLKINY